MLVFDVALQWMVCVVCMALLCGVGKSFCWDCIVAGMTACCVCLLVVLVVVVECCWLHVDVSLLVVLACVLGYVDAAER